VSTARTTGRFPHPLCCGRSVTKRADDVRRLDPYECHVVEIAGPSRSARSRSLTYRLPTSRPGSRHTGSSSHWMTCRPGWFCRHTSRRCSHLPMGGIARHGRQYAVHSLAGSRNLHRFDRMNAFRFPTRPSVGRPPSVAGFRHARESVPNVPTMAPCVRPHVVHRGVPGAWVACVVKAGHRGWTAYRIWGIGAHAGTWGGWRAC